MVSHLVFYQLGLIALVWVFLILYGLWPSGPAAARPMTPQPLLPRGKRSKKPQPFPGLTRQPCCAACEQAIEAPRLLPSPPPPPITSTRGRRRQINTSQHFCPDPACRYGGWLGLGNITSNGHPSSGPWRQLYCSQCRGYFLETHGTPLHGKRVSSDLFVWAVGALAEGLGIRAVYRTTADNYFAPKTGYNAPNSTRFGGGKAMVSHLFYYQLALLALLWLFVLLPLSWPRRSETPPPVPATPITSKRKRSPEPTAFEGLTHKPHCALCERETAQPKAPAPVPPAPMPPTNRRPRKVDTSMHFCPHAGGRYRGWLGLGNLRANGHPSGGPWRQFHCLDCKGYFPEHHGTIFQ